MPSYPRAHNEYGDGERNGDFTNIHDQWTSFNTRWKLSCERIGGGNWLCDAYYIVIHRYGPSDWNDYGG